MNLTAVVAFGLLLTWFGGGCGMDSPSTVGSPGGPRDNAPVGSGTPALQTSNTPLLEHVGSTFEQTESTVESSSTAPKGGGSEVTEVQTPQSVPDTGNGAFGDGPDGAGSLRVEADPFLAPSTLPANPAGPEQVSGNPEPEPQAEPGPVPVVVDEPEPEDEPEEPPHCAEQFFDVPNEAWYKVAVERIGCDGIVVGTAPNHYEGGRDAYRSEMLATLVRLKGYALEAYDPTLFTDVPAGHTFAREITTGVHKGFISGYGDGTFHPDEAVLRTHAAVMITRAMGLDSATCDETLYTDIRASNPSAYCGFVTAVSKAGYFSGNADGTYGVGEFLSRPQMAVVLDRIKAEPGRWNVVLQ